MTDFPATPPLPLFIHPIMRYGIMWEARAMVNANVNVSSTSWPSANLAIYTPFWLPWPYPVRRTFWNNGNAAGNNWDIGIYTAAGARLWSAGSTVGSGNAAPQFVSPSGPLLLLAGRYYLGAVHSTTTAGRSYATTAYAAQFLRQAGMLQEASALPLPAVMTPVAIASAYIPLAGITRTASGF
jgi:hypothetical protein